MSDSDDMPPPAAGSLPTNLRGLNPDELLARGLQAARMSGVGVSGWEPPTRGEVARLFPTYEVVAMLGRGGMGAVFKARQLALDRFVAIKLLPLEISVNQNFVDRFRREARAMAKLNHPNIVSVYEFGQTSEGHLFIVMEFVEGANLAAIIQQVGLDPEQALSLAGQVCTALAYAHSKGVVHRDIKPANVLVNTESHVKVADFGLARLSDPGSGELAQTRIGTVMGTPDYMAPEQKRGIHVDHRADIYSLGVMLYEMLCRQVPHGIFASPSQCIGCDERLDHIVIRAMQQEPELRYQSTAEMKADVEIARTPPPAPPREILPAAPPESRRIGLRIAIGAGVVALAVAGFFTMKRNAPPPKPDHPIAVAAPIPPDTTKVPEPGPVRTESPDPIKVEPPKLASLEMRPLATPKPEPAPPATPVPAPPAPRAATPAPKPPSATGKWLAEQEPQWLAAFAREVSAPFEKGTGDLKRQYLAALNTQLASATRDGHLDAAVAFRAELKLLNDGDDIPALDESASPAALKTMRATYRKTFAILDADRIAKAKIVHARCDAILAQSQTLLTQRQRLDEALEIKARREQLAAAWLQPALGPVERAFQTATKERPFVNSLGMRFVPLGNVGELGRGPRVFFGVWLTRVADFRAFVKDRGGNSKFDYRKGDQPMILKGNGWWTRGWEYGWQNVGFEQTDEHPVVCVSWEDAKAFCAWLTAKERLPAVWLYRLPTDAEWNEAVGLKDQAAGPVKDKRRKTDVYPWGPQWPPPHGAGNFGGEEARASERPLDWPVIAGYRDRFPYTSPVGSFPATSHGLYDVSGNVRQWCEDVGDGAAGDRIDRGSSWCDASSPDLLSARRRSERFDHRGSDLGFRCVLAQQSSAAPAAAAKLQVETTAAPAKFRYAYGFDNPGYRVWTRTGDVWEEKSPSGTTKRFRTTARDTVGDRSGTVLLSQEMPEFEVFVSDREVPEPRIYFRIGKGKWSDLGGMEDIE